MIGLPTMRCASQSDYRPTAAGVGAPDLRAVAEVGDLGPHTVAEVGDLGPHTVAEVGDLGPMPAGQRPTQPTSPRSATVAVSTGLVSAAATSTQSASQRPTTAGRPGFTLVEMLVVILIIGILASLAMAALFASQESARRTRTEGFIAVLNGQMAYRWESYRTRRLPVSPVFTALPAPLTLQEGAARQLIARRQLMRIELPDRWYDVAFDDSTNLALWTPAPAASEQLGPTMSSVSPEPAYTGANGPAISTGPEVLRNVALAPWSSVDRTGIDYITRTSLSYAYQRRYLQALLQPAANKPAGQRPTAQFQGAECLYMILTTGMGDESSGGGVFNQQDFADVDEDGMPEFVDGWGRPISFLRWAPGFRSEMQTGDPVNDHDPFDPRRADPLAFRMFPLIFSAGPDGVHDDGANSPHGLANHSTAFDPISNYVNLNDPYAPAPAGSITYSFRGDRIEESAGIGPNDNIFNQSLQVR